MPGLPPGSRRAGERLGQVHPLAGRRANHMQAGIRHMATLGHHQTEIQRRAILSDQEGIKGVQRFAALRHQAGVTSAQV